MGGVAVGAGPIGRAGDHDVLPLRNGRADRFKRSATHDYRETKRKLPEALQVLRQVPGHAVAVADDADARLGGADDDSRTIRHFGTARRDMQYTTCKTA